MYIEAWTIVDGCLEDTFEFKTEDLYDLFVTEQRLLAEEDPIEHPVEIYKRVHHHRSGIDCECHQYDTDHRPDIVIE